ncbi:MAG: XRE family transcriptional regulator [Candidatus Thiodiazotropha endolucinida]
MNITDKTQETALRELIGDRLKHEMGRKSISADELCQSAGLEHDVLASYLNGARELNLNELRPVCEALSLDIMRLVSHKFEQTKLQYRQAHRKDKKIAGDIENVFLLIRDILPRTKNIHVEQPDRSDNNFIDLVGSLVPIVESIKERYQSVEEIIQDLRISILDIKGGTDGFDAFLLSTNRAFMICVNIDHHPNRIHFSLLHEIAHYLFDKEHTVPVDYYPSSPYSNYIKNEDIPEFLANKFAQFFLVSFAEAQSIRKAWPNISETATQLILTRRTSADVIANAVYDINRYESINRGVATGYQEILKVVQDSAQSKFNDSIRQFVKESGAHTRQIILDKQENYSDSVWSRIADTFEIQH